MSTIYDELRAAVERHYEAGRCALRRLYDVRAAINAMQRFAPDAADLAEIEAACEDYRAHAPVSMAARRDHSGRVRTALRIFRGAPTERWPEGAQVQMSLKLPAEMRAAVLALAEDRGCTARDVIRSAIQAELDANPPAHAARSRARSKARKKTAQNS